MTDHEILKYFVNTFATIFVNEYKAFKTHVKAQLHSESSVAIEFAPKGELTTSDPEPKKVKKFIGDVISVFPEICESSHLNRAFTANASTTPDAVYLYPEAFVFHVEDTAEFIRAILEACESGSPLLWDQYATLQAMLERRSLAHALRASERHITCQ